ncbi:MAG TPA: hypothetical protein PLD20_12450 [Blastocatellia bacterium]|nr:hypothetical protein [Blastocatellia bacterium]HMV84653.1 hypothetical protein [Blastocatellia bacterium]HMX29873.1 hypothetical protein [Blastocatellia bacterium]HMY71047.1 hypothetical protein [Blastocatellia bacterium]HMZ18737.1 hypothetical protein [Blastocatellia bacterium]
MWTDEKQRLLDSLREKEFAGTLTTEEGRRLELLFAEMDQEEEESLRPAFEHMNREHQEHQAEINRLQREKELLAALAAQEEGLLRRARATLQEVQREKAQLRAEYERALSELSRVA